MAHQSRSIFVPSLLALVAITACTDSQSAVNNTPAAQSIKIERVRWTLGQIGNASLGALVSRIVQEKRISLNPNNFELYEERTLATSKFRMFQQVHPLEKSAISSASIRIWENLNGEVIQVEADVVDESSLVQAPERFGRTNFRTLEARAASLVASEWEDNTPVRDVKSSLVVGGNGKLLAQLRLRTSKGWHTYWFENTNSAPIDHKYRPFSRQNVFAQPDLADEYSIDALTFPVADAGNTREFQDNGVRGQLTRSTLRHIKKSVPQRNPVRYFPWESRTFSSSHVVPSILPITDQDISAGFWSYGAIMGRLNNLSATDAKVSNEIGLGNPARLVGRYAAVYWHPMAARAFGFPANEVRLAPKHTTRDGERGVWFVPFHYGIPLTSANDGITRAQTVSPVEKKLPVQLMRQGFDEIQTYDMVTTFFEAMQSMGLTDNEISTKPVNVVLYNPAVTDNAYATLEGEINFGIYTAETPSMARNNATGWHELGHEFIGRLAHPELGGPASWAMHEGVADYFANAIVRTVNDPVMKPHLTDPRPYNTTMFHMNNEVHDAGEPFGGTLVDLTELAEARFGRIEGTKRVMELVLETLRLIRGNPNLTEEVWYEHMLFADSLQRASVVASRRPGELTDLIKIVFGRRNMIVTPQDKLARFDFSYQAQEKDYHTITAKDDFFTISLKTSGTESQKLNLKIEVENGSRAKLTYPLTATIFIRNKKGTGVPVGSENSQEFAHNIVITEPSASFEVPLTIAAKCPASTPATFVQGKKIKLCQSSFRVVLTGSEDNRNSPANHQKRGMLSLTEIL